MRLSEAIREGSKLVKAQIEGEYIEQQGKKIFGACAIGAAAIAAVGLTDALKRIDDSDNQADPNLVEKLWAWAYKLRVKECPVEGCKKWKDKLEHVLRSRTAENMIYHLNDHHQWSFTEIADWVQVQEVILGLGEQAEDKPVATPVKSPEPAHAG